MYHIIDQLVKQEIEIEQLKITLVAHIHLGGTDGQWLYRFLCSYYDITKSNEVLEDLNAKAKQFSLPIIQSLSNNLQEWWLPFIQETSFEQQVNTLYKFLYLLHIEYRLTCSQGTVAFNKWFQFDYDSEDIIYLKAMVANYFFGAKFFNSWCKWIHSESNDQCQCVQLPHKTTCEAYKITCKKCTEYKLPPPLDMDYFSIKGWEDKIGKLPYIDQLRFYRFQHEISNTGKSFHEWFQVVGISLDM
jgi:hypothetical protein